MYRKCFLQSLPKIFEIAGRASVVESTFSKVTEEISTFRKFENSTSCLGIFRKVTLLEAQRNSLLTGVAAVQSTGFNSTKNELLIKFFEGVLRIFENSFSLWYDCSKQVFRSFPGRPASVLKKDFFVYFLLGNFQKCLEQLFLSKIFNQSLWMDKYKIVEK